jgi:phage baseplate assembly protein W
MPEIVSYKDFNLSFKPHPVTEDLMVVKDNADIKQSLKSLLLTKKGERLFNYDIGTNLTSLLFELADYSTASLIRDEMIVVISNFEKRIVIKELTVDVNYEDNGYDIRLSYEIVGRYDTPVNVEFFLESAR